MTLQRQQRKDCSLIVALLFVMALPALTPVLAAAQTLTERIVVNRYTGLALSGFDPVAYFTDGRPLRGREQFEARQSGAVWRFQNEGNRAAFVAHPDVYGPLFGGYDPVDVARGKAVAGSAEIWMIHKNRLLLFDSESSRQAFAADPDGFLRAAQARWESVKAELMG